MAHLLNGTLGRQTLVCDGINIPPKHMTPLFLSRFVPELEPTISLDVLPLAFFTCLDFVHPSLSLSVPLATVSKVPIPKGWRRGLVMSCMHNCTPEIYVLLSILSIFVTFFISIAPLSCFLSV